MVIKSDIDQDLYCKFIFYLYVKISTNLLNITLNKII